MITLLLLFVMFRVGAQQTQQTPYADLTGEWKMQAGDDSRYAEPSFDSNGWKSVDLAWRVPLPLGTFWLRRTLDLPAGVGEQPLAITLGSIDGAYEVSVNGVRLGESDGPVDNPPKSFQLDLSRQREGRLAIQLQCPKGVTLAFVSDGVVEACNAQRELFGFERIREISRKSASEVAEAAKAWGQNDDITVVTVRRPA